MASKKFIQALELLEEEKGIKKEVVLDALKEAMEKSYKRNYAGTESKVDVQINPTTGKIRIFETKDVVDDVMDEDYELSLEEAQAIDPKYQVGDQVVSEVDPQIFGRLAAIQTKQLLRQKIRESEKDALFNEYIDKKDDIINGIVDRVEPNFVIVNIGRTGALLPKNQQIPGEKLVDGQHIKVYVSDVVRETKDTRIKVSRTEPGLVRRLFEQEVPEVFDGTVEIVSVSREAGERSKIAVTSRDENIDPIGSCVGKSGVRVNNVVKELNGEKIDIVEWNEDPVVYISHALSPSEVKHVTINEEDKSALVIVPDSQLSLAIGKRGQNARLAVRLTGWKIDIKSVSEAMAEGLAYDEDSEFNKSFEEEMTKVEEPIAEPIIQKIVEPVKEHIVIEAFDEDENKVEDIEEIFEDEETFDTDESYDDNYEYDYDNEDDYDEDDYDDDDDDDVYDPYEEYDAYYDD
ncbi:MAG: transcription termination factor NusA [Erysipelotrichaceae bacterium]|nr:transcription termination factor NusA [Erysipelotrichaceae bacterium]